MAIGANRSVCRDEPRRGYLSHWLDAHSRKGHGVHSPYLYAMCRAVYAPRGRKPGWISRALPKKEQRAAREAVRLQAWSGAAWLLVPRGWKAEGAQPGSVVEGRICESIARGELARGERVVAVLPGEEWARLSERAWRALAQTLAEGSWLVLLGVRADEASWQRWRWLSECTVFTVCIDRWHYGLVVYRTGMSCYSFGIR